MGTAAAAAPVPAGRGPPCLHALPGSLPAPYNLPAPPPPPPLQIWVDCGKIVQDLLKNQQTKIYFGEPVKESYVPNYYSVIKNPMDLGTIKSTCLRRLQAGQEAAGRVHEEAADGSSSSCCISRMCASACFGGVWRPLQLLLEKRTETNAAARRSGAEQH